MSNIYVHFSQISFPVRYLVVNFQLESHSLRFREVMDYIIEREKRNHAEERFPRELDITFS